MVHVIGAGLPRTGTMSMQAALERLGFGPCHHMFEVLAAPDLARRWADVGAVAPAPVEWHRLLAGWRSGVDWPLSFFWRELADAYPDAKVLLTVRDPHRWFASMRATIFEPARRVVHEGADAQTPDGLRAIRPLLARIWAAHFGVVPGSVPDEDTAVAAFERHAARVRAEIPADRLLEYRVGEGWDRLCAFLGTAIPEEPFPHLNDADAMHAKRKDLFGDARFVM